MSRYKVVRHNKIHAVYKRKVFKYRLLTDEVGGYVYFESNYLANLYVDTLVRFSNYIH